MDLSTATTLMSALGVGALVSSWLGWTKDRREARARTALAMGLVEQRRFAPDPAGPVTHSAALDAFRQAQRELSVAAMLAGLPRQVVDTYLDLTAASFSESRTSWTSGQPIGEPINLDPLDARIAGNISATLDDLVVDARQLISDLVWHAWTTRWKQRLGALEERRDQLVSEKPNLPLRFRTGR